MINLPRTNQKPILIAPQIQSQKRSNQTDFENRSIFLSSAPRKYKCTKSIQTDQTDLFTPTNDNQKNANLEKIHEKLQLKYDKSKSVRYKINAQMQKNTKTHNSATSQEQENTEELNIRNDIPIESVSFKTYIEFDMHGGDYHISDGFDWIQIIRETLNDALIQQVDIVKFIPGQGKHTNIERSPRKIIPKSDKPREPILRALTLVTTKMIGFNSYLDEFNRGVVICPISTYHDIAEFDGESDTEKENRNLLFKVFTSINCFDLENEEILDSNEADYEEKIRIIQRYKAIQKAAPKMIKSCIEIIAIWKKDENEAVEFAQTFMKHFIASDPSEAKDDRDLKKQLRRAKRKDDKKRDDEMIYEMRLVNKFEKKYGFDRDLIERIVEEQHTEEKCEKILDQIYHDMLLPYVFFNKYFADFVSKYETIPMSSLLETFKECDYIPEVVQRRMISHSSLGVRKALRVMKVNSKVDSKRVFNDFFNKQKLDIPKFVPSIEINLENAGIEKATRSVSRVMNGLSTGKFCEMVLVFSQLNIKNVCKIDDIRPFIQQKAESDGYKLFENERGNKSEFHFYIINDDNENATDNTEHLDSK